MPVAGAAETATFGTYMFFGGGHGGTESLSNLPKVTQQDVAELGWNQ